MAWQGERERGKERGKEGGGREKREMKRGKNKLSGRLKSSKNYRGKCKGPQSALGNNTQRGTKNDSCSKLEMSAKLPFILPNVFPRRYPTIFFLRSFFK